MCLRDEVVGMFGLCFEREVEIKQETVEHITTLANQATLAVRLTQLAEEAKLAAIAREQEKAATERTAELAQANESLRRSLDQLANERSLNSFLVHILREAIQMLDGAMAQIFLYDPESDTLQSSIGVKFHVNNIMNKLQADDRTHAVVVALKRGIIKL